MVREHERGVSGISPEKILINSVSTCSTIIDIVTICMELVLMCVYYDNVYNSIAMASKKTNVHNHNGF